MSFMTGFVSGRKDKGFSSKGKIQKFHEDGSESIIVMGSPFRVITKIADVPHPNSAARVSGRTRRSGDKGYYVFLVENTRRLPEFPRHLALKRSFFGIGEVAEAHKELDIMSRIKDKNIVRVYHSEVSRSEGQLSVSIAMEYCSNNLYRRMKSGAGSGAGTRLSESEICHVLLALTSAIGYLHSLQPPVTHRDIRPENILINNNHTGPAAYKLCNFGNATTEAYLCQSREEANMAIEDIELHTHPAFRAPEMADPWSGRKICEKTDLWAIGVLLYYMMYGTLPFEATNMALSGNPRPKYPASEAGRYTGSLRVVLEHLLEPNPDDRWDIFALTNFLRFDEDVSRHLGTFFFTRTEWPEGWEEQDVRVLNRDPPAKAPAVHYDEEGHEQLEQGPPPKRNYVDYPAGGSSGGGGRSANDDAAMQEAIIMLESEGKPLTPELQAYKQKLVQEQEAALAQFSNSKRGGGGNDVGDLMAPPAQAPAPAEEPKKDLFDDLFAGPAAPPAANNNINSGNAPEQQQQQQQQQKDMFDANDLFSAPVQPQNNYNNNYNNWQAGAPMDYNNNNNMYGGGIPQQQNYNSGGWGGQQQQQQQQQQPPMNNYDFLAGPSTNNNPNYGQPQQNNNNNNTNNNNNNTAPPAATGANKDSRRDPFADLWS